MNNSADSTKRKKRTFRWRSLIQFRLSTLLLLIFIGALASFYYTRPKWKDEILGGGFTVRYEERIVTEPGGPEVAQRHGRYQLIDSSSNVMIDGRYKSDTPHGRWTTYYANGRKQLEGVCDDGFKVGPWTAWHANGQMKYQVTYEKSQRVYWKQFSLAESKREGAFQAWDADGNVTARGQHKADMRTGEWLLPNGDGPVRSESYLKGLVTAQRLEKGDRKDYVLGHPVSSIDGVVELLEEEFAFALPNQRGRSQYQLRLVGRSAESVIAASLADSNPNRRFNALRLVLDSLAEDLDLESELRNATQGDNSHIGLFAWLALYHDQDTRTPEVLRSLLTEFRSAETGTRRFAVSVVANTVEHIPQLSDLVYSSDQQTRADAHQFLVSAYTSFDSQNERYINTDQPPVRDLLKQLVSHGDKDIRDFWDDCADFQPPGGGGLF